MTEFQQETKTVGKLNEKRSMSLGKDTEDLRICSRWCFDGTKVLWAFMDRTIHEERWGLSKKVQEPAQKFKTMMEEDF